MIPSPCINVCEMDAATGLCIGCLRTLPEIVAWTAASDDEKRAILAAVEERRKLVAPGHATAKGEPEAP